MSLYRGGLRKAGEGLQNGQSTLGDQCRIHLDTAAVIPFRIDVENLTDGFANKLLSTVIVQETKVARENTNSAVYAQIQYANGSDCQYLTGQNGAPSQILLNENLEPGEVDTTFGFFLIENYYSPNQPSGNRDLGHNFSLTFTPKIGIGSGIKTTVTRADGFDPGFTVGDSDRPQIAGVATLNRGTTYWTLEPFGSSECLLRGQGCLSS